MNIKDIMSKDVIVVAPTTTLNDVAKKMKDHDCGSILVASDDRLLGVITDRDLTLRSVAESLDPAKTTADKVMTKEVLYCRDGDDVASVAENMTRNKVRRLPVLDENKRLVGIVSLGDIAANGNDEKASGTALGAICKAA